jgi:WD40 repeat protein
VAFADNGRALSAGNDAFLRVWDVETAQQVCAFKVLPEGQVASVALSPDGKLAAAGSAAPSFCLGLWDMETGQQRFRWPNQGITWGLAFSRDGRRLLSGNGSQEVILWDVEAGQRERVFTGHDGSVMAAAFSPDGRHILSGGEDRIVHLWDVEGGAELHRFRGHKAMIRTVAFSPDGRYALSGDDEGAVLLWSLP